MDAQLIRKAREVAGESQAAFAARFGVDQSTVHRWETDGPPVRGPAKMALVREINVIMASHAAGTGEGTS